MLEQGRVPLDSNLLSFHGAAAMGMLQRIGQQAVLNTLENCEDFDEVENLPLLLLPTLPPVLPTHRPNHRKNNMHPLRSWTICELEPTEKREKAARSNRPCTVRVDVYMVQYMDLRLCLLYVNRLTMTKTTGENCVGVKATKE